MPNTLSKPVVSGSSASVETIAVYNPGYTAIEPVTTCGFVQTTELGGSAASWGWYTDANGNHVYGALDASGNPAGGTSTQGAAYICSTVEQAVTYPATTTASQIVVYSPESTDIGWNFGARSQRSIVGNGRATFYVAPATSGAVVGFNDFDNEVTFAEIDHAWYFANGIAQVMESGLNKHTFGAYLYGDEFSIERIDSVVFYRHNGTLAYTSLTPSTNIVFIDTSLYASNDTVYDLNLVDLSGANAPMMPLRSLAVQVGAEQTFSYAAFAPLVSQSGAASRSDASMLPLIGLSGTGRMARVDAHMKPLTALSMSGLPLPKVSFTAVALLPIFGAAIGKTGSVGSSAAAMAALGAVSSGDNSLETDYGYSMCATSMLPLIGVSYAYEGNTNATLHANVGAFSVAYGLADIAVFMRSDLSVAAVLAVHPIINADAQTDITVATEMALQAVLNAQMQSVVFAGFGIPLFDTEQNDCAVWVVNANTEATTRYENFAFNSYGLFDGRYFGCKTDGLYLLEGDKDGVDPIRASIDFGNDNFGTAQLKSCLAAYLGVGSSGTMYLKLTVEGEEYIYAARADSAEMQTQRVDLGRGIRANYLRFELFNSDGCDFELDSVEFAVVALSRRI